MDEPEHESPFNRVVWMPRFKRLGNIPFVDPYKVVRASRIEVNREGVFVDGKQILRRAELYGTSLTKDDDGNWFAVVWGRWGSVTIGVRGLQDGKDLIRALSADAKSIIARFVLSEVGAGKRFALIFSCVFVALTASIAFLAAGMKPVGSVLVPLTLTVMAAMVYWEMVFVTVGADGLVVRKGFRKRFIAHDRILGAKREGVDLVVMTADGELRWQMTVRRDAKGKALEAGASHAESIALRINEARAAFDELGGDASSIPALARAGKTTSDWLDALRRIGREVDAGFRGGVVGRERLWTLVESTQAPASFRVTAAVALRLSGEDEKGTSVRLREIAEVCATPNLGKRLRVAAGASEAELVELLEENEEVSASRSSES